MRMNFFIHIFCTFLHLESDLAHTKKKKIEEKKKRKAVAFQTAIQKITGQQHQVQPQLAYAASF